MSDPERLLDQNADGLGSSLLRAARGDSPPSGLTRRTLAALGVAGAVTAAGSASAAAGTASASASAAVPGASVAAGGGLLSAIAAGAIAGLITFGIIDWTTGFGLPGSGEAASEARTALLGSAAPHTAGALSEARPLAADRMDSARPAAPAVPSALSSSGVLPSSGALPPTRALPPGRRSSALASEIALLDAARRSLLEGDPAGALARLDRHAREFAGGQLTREAAVLRIEALAKRGDSRGASAAARQFLKAYPDSPHADQIEAAAGSLAPKESVIDTDRPGD